jgi:hypothetical protein
MDTKSDITVTYEATDHERQFCKDPAFYVWGASAHEHVATVTMGDREIKVFCDGEMRLHVWASKEARIDNINPEVIRYCDRLVEAGIDTDEKLQKALDEERIEFDNNAWFDLYANDDMVGDAGWLDCVHFDLDEAVLQASELIESEELWSQTQ